MQFSSDLILNNESCTVATVCSLSFKGSDVCSTSFNTKQILVTKIKKHNISPETKNHKEAPTKKFQNNLAHDANKGFWAYWESN